MTDNNDAIVETEYLNIENNGDSANNSIAKSSTSNKSKADSIRENEASSSSNTNSFDNRNINSYNDANNFPLTKNLIFAVVASSVCGSFQHGYNGGVVNAPERLISQFINETYTHRYKEPASDAQIDLIYSTIVSIFCIGGFIGSLATAFVADKIGRREGLLLNNALVVVAAPLMFGSRSFKSYELLIVGRFLIGINAGLNAGIAPLYINEICPANLRASLGAIYQLVITASIFISNVFGLPAMLGNYDDWPLLFAIPLLPAAFMISTLPRCAESQKLLLIVRGKELEAQRALSWFRQTADVQNEMEILIAEAEQSTLMPVPSLKQMLINRRLRKPLTVAVFIMLSQQLTGINAVLFFSTSIFRSAGMSEEISMRLTLGLTLLNFLVTIGAIKLVENVGRKTLQLAGLLGMAVACTVLAICLGGNAQVEHIQTLTTTSVDPQLDSASFSSYIAVAAMFLFIVMFAIGPGCIPWFLVTELFPSNAQTTASSIAVAVNWLANFTVLLTFLPLTNELHGYTFLVFAVLSLIFYAFTYYKVPETKGATSEEIEALFQTEY